MFLVLTGLIQWSYIPQNDVLRVLLLLVCSAASWFFLADPKSKKRKNALLPTFVAHVEDEDANAGVRLDVIAFVFVDQPRVQG